MDKSWEKLFGQKIRIRGKEYAYYCVSDYMFDERGVVNEISDFSK